MTGSSQHNKDKKDQKEIDVCPKHCKSITSNSQKLKKNDKLEVNSLRNGDVKNQDFKAGSSIKSISNVYSKNNLTNHNCIPTITTCNLVSNYSITNQARRESNSLTLNHNYEKEEEEGKCIELNVYRYKGWKNSLNQNTFNATKSTLV